MTVAAAQSPLFRELPFPKIAAPDPRHDPIRNFMRQVQREPGMPTTSLALDATGKDHIEGSGVALFESAVSWTLRASSQNISTPRITLNGQPGSRYATPTTPRWLDVKNYSSGSGTASRFRAGIVVRWRAPRRRGIYEE